MITMATKKMFDLDVVSVKLNPEFKLMSDRPIETPNDVALAACRLLKDSDREMIAVFNLQADGRPINCHIAAVGTLDSCIAHPRELLKSTILANASSVILAHNHPSNSLEPSSHDIHMTTKLAKLCNLLEIRLLDHVIVGSKDHSYLSMFEKGILEKRPSGEIDVSDSYIAKVAERSPGHGYHIERRDRSGKVR